MPESVVQRSLGEWGPYLAMRPRGREVLDAVDSILRELPPGGVLIMDLQNVQMMDYSFADEALGTLFSRLAANEYADRYLILLAGEDELSRALLENIEAALQQREVAALVIAGPPADPSSKTNWRVLGRLPEHLQETLAAVVEQGQVTVRDLADALNIESVTACNNRVARLYQLHLVRRKASIVPEGGRQYFYSSLV